MIRNLVICILTIACCYLAIENYQLRTAQDTLMEIMVEAANKASIDAIDVLGRK